MRRHAHAETPFILALFQLLVFVPPVLWWHRHGHPPAWTMWFVCQLIPALFLIGFFAVGFAVERLDDLWRRHKTKKNRH